jgi:flagellar operon protein
MVPRIESTPLAATRAAPAASRRAQPLEAGFANMFAKELHTAREVKFSAHALQRLRERNIALTPTDKARIERGLDLAASKGARETLLLTDRLALVASVPNRTVITAVPRNDGEDAVFTNIDSVVVVGSRETPAVGTEQPGLDPFGEALAPPNDRGGATPIGD